MPTVRRRRVAARKPYTRRRRSAPKRRRTTARRTVVRRRPAARRAPARSRVSKSMLGTVSKAVGYIGQLLPSPYNSYAKAFSRLGGIITGHGDYSMSGGQLTGSVPYIRNTKRGFIIQNREYIMDIGSGAGTPTPFKIDGLNLNPGVSSTFPWLSQIARNFEEYRFSGLVFEYKTLSVDAIAASTVNIGSVFMACDYNVLHGTFSSKQAVENYEFSVSGKPSQTMMLPIECKRAETPVSTLYVRDENMVVASSDLRLYDLGLMCIGSQGLPAPANSIGELWVSYEVEFFKPNIISSSTAGGDTLGCSTYWTLQPSSGSGWTSYQNAAGGGIFGYRAATFYQSSLPFQNTTDWTAGIAGPTVFENFLSAGGIMQPNTNGALPGQPQPGQVGFLVPVAASTGITRMYLMYDTQPHLYYFKMTLIHASAAAAISTFTILYNNLNTAPGYLSGSFTNVQTPASPVATSKAIYEWLALVPGLGSSTDCGDVQIGLPTWVGTPSNGELVVTRIY